MALSDLQIERYGRNLLIPAIGEAGQERLKAAKICIVGLGGLGSPAAFYLAAAGVGTLGLMDSDAVELSNLQRQVLHTTPDLGMRKADSAVKRLTATNPDVTLRPLDLRLTAENAAQLLSQYDAVVEATDNFEAKYLINDVCVAQGIPFATAGILALSGQGLFVVPGKTPCLRCAVPEIPLGVPTTGQLGVLGAVPGILGSIEAMEIIRYITGVWSPADDGSGRLHVVDGDTMRLRTVRIARRSGCACASRNKA